MPKDNESKKQSTLLASPVKLKEDQASCTFGNSEEPSHLLNLAGVDAVSSCTESDKKDDGIGKVVKNECAEKALSDTESNSLGFDSVPELKIQSEPVLLLTSLRTDAKSSFGANETTSSEGSSLFRSAETAKCTLREDGEKTSPKVVEKPKFRGLAGRRSRIAAKFS